MPLFTTLLIYLDAEWRREWDAETLFLDAPTGTGVFVRPRGGRAVMMDQDVTHRISTPSQVGVASPYFIRTRVCVCFFPVLPFVDRQPDRQRQACVQGVDGDHAVLFYFFSHERVGCRYSVTVRDCSFEGKVLRHRA